jgi:phosphinothricin acetyltransferase
LIRLATSSDAAEINKIYNQAVVAKCTAHTTALPVEYTTDWLNQHDPEKYPVFVYQADQTLSGWLSLSPYREGRKALEQTAEISFYVDNKWQRKGMGRSLITHAMAASRQLQISTLIAFILGTNSASTSLLNRFGFDVWGRLPGIAKFDDYYCDHIIMGKTLA